MKLIWTSHRTFTSAKNPWKAKFWLNSVRLARAGRFKAVELGEIERIINDNLDFLLSAWEKEQSKRANG